MPTEFSRTTATLNVTLPNGDIVPVPVITKISFIDPISRYQEFEITIDNSSQSAREVHVDDVVSSADPSGTPLQVERVDVWPIIDAIERGQETQLSFDNKTGADSIPPSFITHVKTHVVRCHSTTSPSWVDTELIDEFHVLDPVDRAQETQYILNNPDDGSAAQADPNDPVINDDAIDPPYRTDPFQNIVDFSGEITTAPQEQDLWFTIVSPQPTGWFQTSYFGQYTPWGPPAWLADTWHPTVSEYDDLVGHGPDDPVHAPAAYAFFNPILMEFGSWTGGGHGPPSPPRGSWYILVKFPGSTA